MSATSSAPEAEARFRVDFALDLRRTLRPLGGVFRPDGWWRPARTPAGTATLHLSRTGGEVRGRAWGDGGAWMLGRIPQLVGAGDRPDQLVTAHPLVGELARRNPGYRFGATGLVMEKLVTAIVAQKVTHREARRAMAGLQRRFSEPAPGPLPLPLPPDPDRLAVVPYWELHDLGLEKRRADTLIRVATQCHALSGLVEESPASARDRLIHVTGVGPWTVAETLAVSHGDPDSVSVGDFHLKNLVVWHLTGRPRGSDDEMLELLEEFRPHRGRVVRLLATLGRPPAYGPRLAPRTIAGR